MADVVGSRRWVGQLTYGLIAVTLIFVQLLPLNTMPPGWAPPDLLLAVTMVWVARRPDLVPVLLVAVVFLLTDLLFQRPPGLMTGLVLIATEMLRARAAGLRSAPFALEWATVSVMIIALTLGNRLILAAAMTPPAPLGLTMVQLLMTCLSYPLIAGLAHLIFGVTRPAPGEVNALGQRI